MSAPVALRPYQREAADAVSAAWRSGMRRPGVSMATGAGKSVLLAKIIEESGERTLVIGHRKEIVEQNAEKLGYFMDPFDIGIVMADTKQIDRPVISASIQTIAGNRALQQAMGRFGLVTIDEAHHVAAPTWVETLRAFSVGQGLQTKALGVTATWDRSDGVGLDHIIDEIVYTKDIESLIIEGYLCDIEAIRIVTEFDETPNGSRDWSDADVARRVQQANLSAPVAHAVREFASDRTSLVFSPDVETAYLYRDALRHVGISSEVVHGETAKTQRTQLLRDLKTGRIAALVNCGIYTEGTDIPIVDCIVMGRPTKSRSLFQQMLGRGLRTYPGKQNCLVLDIVGATEQHKLQTTASLFGLPLSPGKQRIGSVRTRLTDPEADPDFDAASFRIEARKVEVIDRSRFAWSQVTLEADAFSLPAGDEGTLFLDGRKGDSWRVVQVDRDRHVRELASGLDIGYAQGIAEQFVRESGVGLLAAKEARWRKRNEPATENQRTALLNMRISFDEAITKVDASNLIRQELDRRAFGRLR